MSFYQMVKRRPSAAPADTAEFKRAYSSWPQFGGETDVLAKAIAEARRLQGDSRALETRRTYEKHWARFVRWTAEVMPMGTDCVPCNPAVICAYIGHLSGKGLTKSYVNVSCAAIAYAHELMRVPSPLTHPDVHEAISGLSRQVNEPRQYTEALTIEVAEACLAKFKHYRSIVDIRDRAVFALTWLSALRRSNIAMLQFRDIEFHTLNGKRWVFVSVVKSKTDQKGEGRIIRIPERGADKHLCAVRTLEAWIQKAGIKDGSLFRTFTTNGTDNAKIDPQVVVRAVKRIVFIAGLDPAMYAPHSLRRGFVTSADAMGQRPSQIREHGGWKSDQMIAKYTKLHHIKDNALAGMFGEE